MRDTVIERVEPEDEEILEEWARQTDQPDLLGVGSSRLDDDEWPWQVFVSVMEFVRTEPLETELVDAVTAALRSVPGVQDAVPEDREVWVVRGDAAGDALVAAVARVLDAFEPRTRAALDALDGGA